jgi:hypothetical protein
MTKTNRLSKMPNGDKKSSKRANADKKYLKRVGGGKGGRDDDDSSIDSKGNIRNLIDYEYDENNDSDSISTSNSVSCATPRNTPPRSRSPRKPRKAAIKANNIIRKNAKKELSKSENYKTQNNKIKNSKSENVKTENSKSENNKKKPTRQLTPTKRRYPFKAIKKNIKNSTASSSDDSIRKQLKMSDDEYEYTSNEEEDNEEDADEENSKEEDADTEGDDYEDEDKDDEEDDEDYNSEEDEDYEDNSEDEEDDNSNKSRFGGIILTLGGSPGGPSMIPKKYNMKKESKSVKKFVKLLTSPVEENSIDTQIEQFKALDENKQNELITALEKRPTANDTGINLMLKILTLKLTPEVQGMILSKYHSLQNLDTSSNEYFKLRSWLDKAVSIPFGIYKDIPVRLDDGPDKCAEFMRGAKKCLDDAVYGQDESKLQIMQFISTKIANPEGRGLSLLLVGPPGVGKTSLIKNGIAKALGWPFQFISLGGDSDASTYTGHQLVYESSHCGKIVNSLVASKSMSTVLMFDEVDKISQTPKGEEVMNLLIHLTDPVQNADFEDKYLSGIPIDLSKVMFVFSANDINKIDKVLLDRMMVIDLKGYDLKQKSVIAEQYLLPTALKEVNLTERIAISSDIMTNIIEDHSKEEKGVRELKRSIEQITQKINMLRMYNSPDLPFYIKDFSLPFIVKKEHIKLFLKKKENKDSPPQGMYC